MSSSLATIDRARGVLLGLAVGDALGGPIEFMSPEQIARNEAAWRAPSLTASRPDLCP